MRVAFLGLGIMGRPMAANLVKAGHEVTVWNRTPGKEVEGARIASSPAKRPMGLRWSGFRFRTPVRWKAYFSDRRASKNR